jgi:hypothetical protein
MRRKDTSNRTLRWTPLVTGVATALLCALAAVAAPAPAAAALPGAAVRSQQSRPFSSEPTRAVAAYCPEGTRVTGGGGRVDGNPDHVVLTRMRPVHTNNLDRFEVAAAEDETGTSLQWTVTAIALCASPVDGMEIVSETRPGNDTLTSFALITCPTGKLPIGGGGQITGGKGQVHLGYMRDQYSHSTLARGMEDTTGFDGDWTVTAYAVCVPFPPPGSVRTVAEHSEVDSQNPQDVPAEATAACPAGMTVTGAYGISFGDGDRNAVVQSVAPAALPGGLPGGEATVVARENNEIDGTWSVTAMVSCHR